MTALWKKRTRRLSAAALILATAACGEAEQDEAAGPGSAPAAAGSVETAAVAVDDPALFEAGRRAYRQCVACHRIDREETLPNGPHLVGLLGRPAGAVDAFAYSDAMLESGIVWTEETIAAYLRDVRGYIPGNRMNAPNVRDEERLEALIYYIAHASRPAEG